MAAAARLLARQLGQEAGHQAVSARDAGDRLASQQHSRHGGQRVRGAGHHLELAGRALSRAAAGHGRLPAHRWPLPSRPALVRKYARGGTLRTQGHS